MFRLVLIFALLSACSNDQHAPTTRIEPQRNVDEAQPAWKGDVDKRTFGKSNISDLAFYSFSQVNVGDEDGQIYRLQPDINIRAWQRWRENGTRLSDYNQSAIKKYKASGIKFIGGSTSSVVFSEEEKFSQVASRDSRGRVVAHTQIAGMRRANLAHPAYRDYLINIAKIQIDIGVDGLFFDEVSSSYNGTNGDGNEGFDRYHLTDFNRYLCKRFAGLSTEELKRKFLFSDSNYLKCNAKTFSPEDNFNYLDYLSNIDLLDEPLSRRNPLAKIWGRTVDNRPNPSSPSFVEYAINEYWQEIVLTLREYARETQNKEILITANGIYPFVDFQSIGLYPYNEDQNGHDVNYLPVKKGRLDGSVSLRDHYARLKRRSQVLAGDVPVVIFIDWPTRYMDDYFGFSDQERKDFLKIYVSEAYANGLFFAFPVRTSMPEDPTAADQGMLDFVQNLGNFFRLNKEVYTNIEVGKIMASHVSKSVSVSTSELADGRHVVHLVNHSYQDGIVIHENSVVRVRFPDGINDSQLSVTAISHDFGERLNLPVERIADGYRIVVPKLDSYLALIIDKR